MGRKGANSKHNWGRLKQEYLKGTYLNLKDFATKKNIPYDSLRKKSGKWHELRTKAEEKGEEKTIEKVSDAVAEMNLRHIVQAKELVEHGRDALGRLDFESASGAVQAVKTGIEIEREVILPKGKDNQVTVIFKGHTPKNYGQAIIKKGEEKSGE